jgi:hypothetical protein
MEHVQHVFYEASHWNLDNSYGTLNATARGTSHCAFRRKTPPTDCASIARLPDTQGPEAADLVPCRPQFCHIVHPGQRRSGRRLRVLPVLVPAAAAKVEELRARSAQCHQRLQTAARAASARRGLAVGDMAEWEAYRPEKYVVAVLHAAQWLIASTIDTLLYGRIFLPQSRLEALYLRA